MNDSERLLGELVASGKARGEQMDRMERKLDKLATSHAETRSMVMQDRAAVGAMKWVVGVVVLTIGALGLDRFR